MKFRKRPVVIDAIQFEGGKESSEEIKKFCFPSRATWHYSHDTLSIETLEGWSTASKGDWIIRGVKGEYYPCKPDVFEITYEPWA